MEMVITPLQGAVSAKYLIIFLPNYEEVLKLKLVNAFFGYVFFSKKRLQMEFKSLLLDSKYNHLSASYTC